MKSSLVKARWSVVRAATWIGALVALSCGAEVLHDSTRPFAPQSPVPAALQAGKQPYDVAAYVWPDYQPEPRWAELGIFDKGVGEWQNVDEARTKWPGHRQPMVPLWGYENEADPTVVAKKIDAASAAGVNVFIYDCDCAPGASGRFGEARLARDRPAVTKARIR